MRVSKQLNNNSVDLLHKTLADINSPAQIANFLSIFLAENEHLMLAKRLNIAYLLEKGIKYRSIIKYLKVSPSTISEIKERLKLEGAQIALNKIKAEEWAMSWENKIRKFVKII